MEDTKYGVCPNCGEFEKIDYLDVDVINENAYQHCECKKCGAKFDDIYIFVGNQLR